MKIMKNLGLVAVAVAALMAFVGVSSAAAAEFHSSAGSASLEGNQTGTHKFTVTGSEVTCTTAKFTGTGAASGTSATQEVSPTYSGCTAFGFAGATVNTAGCKYLFNANTNTVELKSCTAGGATILVNVPFIAKCHVFIKNQTGINGISYENVAGKKSFKVDAKSNNIHAEVLDSTGLCPLVKGSTHTNSSYTGLTTLTANSGAAEIWRE